MTTNTNPRGARVLRLLGATGLAAVAACGGPQIDRSGWQCWEEVACAEGYFCNASHQCEMQMIADIPGVDPAALAAFNDGIRAMSESPVDYSSARAAFSRAIEIDADFWEAYENIGLIDMDLARYSDAADMFRREAAVIEDLVSRDWPVQPRLEVYLDIGKALALSGDTAGAAEAFATMLQSDPENVEAQANLGALNLQQRNLEGARQFVQGLLVQAQNDVGALSVLALIAKDSGDMHLAEYLWEKCLQEIDSATAMVDVDCESLERSEGETLTPEEQYCSQYEGLTEEQASLRRAYNTRRGERMTKLLSDIQNELGIVAWNDGRDDEAESFFRRAVENNPSNSAARVNLGTVYLKYASWSAACEQFGSALGLRPRNREALVGDAACTFGGGDAQAALQRYETALQQYPDDTFITESMGDIAFQSLSDYELAMQWYGRNLQQKGTNIDSCDANADQVCRKIRSIRDVMRAQREAQQNGGAGGGDDEEE
ncbi:MAG: tetratricopeptide repeat protein [Myxococcales bacterium]|nr:tetratricopeptide repeat protein [Myxococcales bacterium]